MTRQRQLHLNLFIHSRGHHEASWRHPLSSPLPLTDIRYYQDLAQRAEAGLFDAIFLADQLALGDDAAQAARTWLEPVTVLAAVAAVTSRIGLIATASTTYNEPYHIARKFASLDHISGGRAGWNLVTTANPDAALNFGHDEHMAHGERYKRAREFFDAVTGLWDSWADDAFVRDVESGIYFDPDRLRVLDHKGPELSVRGPLNIARPVQGWPVIVQAGSSEAGRQIAAETAEAVFSAPSTLDDGRRFYADVKGRMDRLGRNRDHLKILPGCFVVVGETVAEAREKRALLDSLVHYDSAVASLSIALGVDASRFDPDGPLPEIPETEASKSGRERAIALGRREGLTVRQLAQRLGGYAGLAMVGTPATVADEMEEWLAADACDGFNVMFPYLPGGLDEFVDGVVPELQRRGLFRREYEGATLRENLGLPRPANRFFPPRS
jgi:alkanesulfonate monooxygenase